MAMFNKGFDFGFVAKLGASDPIQDRAAELELAIRREKALRPVVATVDYVGEARIATQRISDTATVISVTGSRVATAKVAAASAADHSASVTMTTPAKRNMRTKAGKAAAQAEKDGIQTLLRNALAAGTGVHCFSSSRGDAYSAHVRAGGPGWSDYVGYDNGQLSQADKRALETAIKAAHPGCWIDYIAD